VSSAKRHATNFSTMRGTIRAWNGSGRNPITSTRDLPGEREAEEAQEELRRLAWRRLVPLRDVDESLERRQHDGARWCADETTRATSRCHAVIVVEHVFQQLVPRRNNR
jgi:hypothetical protein